MAVYSSDEILDFAIDREQEAHDFYVALAGRSERPETKEFLTRLAREELRHKKKLEEIRGGSRAFPAAKHIEDLDIGEGLADVEASGELDYQDALVLAMKREEAAFRLYTDLSKLAGDEELKRLFLALAQEEAKHRLRFESEYRETFLDQGRQT